MSDTTIPELDASTLNSESTVVIQSSVLVNFGLELGIFAVVSTFFAFLVLYRIRGDFSLLDVVFAAKKWTFLNDERSLVYYSKLLKSIVYSFLIMPVISMALWGITQISIAKDENSSTVPGISILLIGFAMIFLILAILYIKWSNFRIKRKSVLFMGLAFGLYTAWQVFALFSAENVSFLGLSAVFLSLNGLIVVIMAYMAFTNTAGSFESILERLPARPENESGSYRKHDEKTPDEQYQLYLNDSNYKVTQQEILSCLSISYNGNHFEGTILNGGIQSILRNKRKWFKIFVLLLIYSISVGVLIIYSALVSRYTTQGNLGWITSIAVWTTDFIAVFIHQLRVHNGPVTMAILLIGMRCFLFGFGDSNWFVGYCGLYLFLGVIINFQIASRHYPISTKLEDPRKKKPSLLRRLVRYPEFTQCLTTSVFIAFIIVISVVNFDIGTNKIEAFGGQYDVYWLGIAAIIYNVIIFCILATLQLHRRSLKRISDKVKLPLIKKHMPTYLIYNLITFCLLVTTGVIWIAITGEALALVSFIFIPIILQLMWILYSNWVRNDYRFLADIAKINAVNRRMRELLYKGQNLPEEEKENANEKEKEKKEMKESVKIVEHPPKDRRSSLKKQEDAHNNSELQILVGKEQSLDKSADESLIQERKENTEKTKIIKDHEVESIDVLNSGSAPAKNTAYQIHEDWRALKMNVFKAFFKKKLMGTDYRIIFSLTFLLILLVVYAVLVMVTSNSYKYVGFIVSFSVFVAICTVLPTIGYFGTLKRPNCSQMFFYGFGVFLNYMYGTLFAFFGFSEGVSTDQWSLYGFVIYYAFLLPFAFFTIVGFRLWRDRKWRMSKVTTACFIFSTILLIGTGVYFLVISELGAAIGFWCGSALFIYLVAVKALYHRRNNSLPRILILVTVAVIFAALLAIFVISLLIDSFNDFVGFSIFYLGLVALAAVYTAINVFNDFRNSKHRPIFYSPWLFPIYRYNPVTETLHKYNFKGGLSVALLFAFWIWTVLQAIWVYPVHYGVATGVLVEIVAAIWMIYLCTLTTSQLNEALAFDNLFEAVVKRSWLQAKRTFLSSNQALKFKDILSYPQYLEDELYLSEYIKKKKEKYKQSRKKKSASAIAPAEKGGAPKVSAEGLKSLYEQLFMSNLATRLYYNDEVKMIIHFEMLIINEINNLREQERQSMLSFIRVYKSKLETSGMQFNFPPENLSSAVKHRMVMQRYYALQDAHRELFDSLKKEYDKHLSEERERALVSKEIEQKATAQREEQRYQKLYHMFHTQNADYDADLPIDQLPDNAYKYNKIVEKYRQTGQIWEDHSFPANEQSIGGNLLGATNGWKRLPQGCSVISKKYSPLDITQGQIQDAYLLSALSCMSPQLLQQTFLVGEKDYRGVVLEQVPDCGAVIVRFYFERNPIEVIIDTQFPINKEGDWAFGRSSDPKEIWVMAVEKAYAKICGSYANIVSGKVSFGLRDLSGGFPDDITISDMNADMFWDRLVDYKRFGYLLGAGSPECQNGQIVTSPGGIIQGHAYAVLDAIEADGIRLVKLRNPPGHRSAEWKGSWCDNAPEWTERLRKLTGAGVKEEGAFFIELSDFRAEFQTLYLVRVFDPRIWKSPDAIHGKWEGSSAAGLPSAINRGADISLNPQYILRVNKKCQAFIVLTQFERVDCLRGKFPLSIIVQRNGGKRITNNSSDLKVAILNPTDQMNATLDVTLEAPYYPYTFTIMVSSFYAAPRGEGKYKLRVFCTGKFDFEPLPLNKH